MCIKNHTKLSRSLAVTSILLAALAWLPNVARTDEYQDRRRSLVVEVVERTGPAVVNISTERIVEVSRRRNSPFWTPFDDMFSPFPGQTYYEKRQSLGSGVIVDEDGYVVTNAHVVRRASRIIVSLRDGSETEATLIGESEALDLAIVKVDKPGKYPAVPFGASDELMIGETVVVIGNPFGLQNTVTTGVLSALEREVTIGQAVFPGLIQTDAAINPGNSGGPLVDVNGNLIGIAMAIQSEAEGISFAIPSRRVRTFFEEYVYNKVSVEEFLGVAVQELTQGLADYFGCERNSGVVVVNVDRKSPAEKAGIRNGDLLTNISGKALEGTQAFHDVLSQTNEKKITVTYIREKGAKPQEVKIDIETEPLTKQGEEVGPWMGLTAKSIDSITARKQGLELDTGVIVTKVDPDSPSGEVGFRPGDLITDVGSFRINSISDFRKATKEYEAEPPQVQLRVYRPGSQRAVVVVLDRGRQP